MSAINGNTDLPNFSNSGKPLSWRFRHINLKFVLASQQWATIIITIIVACIPVAIIHWSTHPRDRITFIYDATISYPMAPHDSVPAWAAVVIPLILLILTVIVGEFVIYKPNHDNMTNALTTTLHFVIDALAAFICTILVQITTKSAVGRLRPDFLARCKPKGAENYTFHLQYGTYTYQDCSEANQYILDDGRSSFPSGHACMSAVLVFYTAGYFLWAIYYRHRESVFGRFIERKNWLGYFLKDFGHAAALYWILINIGFSWAVAGSRIVDNKHHPSDVIAGFFLGATVAIIFLLRAIPCLKFVPLYNMTTEGAEHLRGGEHGVGDNRLEMAEQGVAVPMSGALAAAHGGGGPRDGLGGPSGQDGRTPIGRTHPMGVTHSIPLN